MRKTFLKLTPLFAVTVVLVAGCDGSAACPTTFLDVLNTVFLGITAAGGIAIIRNI